MPASRLCSCHVDKRQGKQWMITEGKYMWIWLVACDVLFASFAIIFTSFAITIINDCPCKDMKNNRKSHFFYC